jgi:hypothetical protein
MWRIIISYPRYSRLVIGSVLMLGMTLMTVPSARGAVPAGPIVIGKSISGVTLGMTKNSVVSLLGPADEVPNDLYFGYNTTKEGLLQIFFEANIVTSVQASGSDFCISKGPCLDSKGLIATLKKSNKTAKKVLGEDSDYLEITTKAGTKKTVTSFSIDGATSFNVTIRR